MDDRETNGAHESSPGDQHRRNGAHFVPLADLGRRAPRLDIDAIRAKLGSARGREYWRRLEDVTATEDFRRQMEREFPFGAPGEMEGVSRREFFRLMGASLALAGVAGCATQPAERIVPYVEQPENLVLGKPLYFATTYVRSGYGYGILAESQTGRPVKLEGNPDHPGSMGKTDVFMQASLLNLYDPDRSQSVRKLQNPTGWDDFLGVFQARVGQLAETRGAGLRLLTGTVTSPTLAAQIRQVLAHYPGARVHQYEPVSQANVLAGARMAFGRELQPVYHFDRADVILSLDCNFLHEEVGSVRYAWDFGAGRRPREKNPVMNRLYVAESTPTITGAKAEHRLPVNPAKIEGVARAVLAGVSGGGAAAAPEGVPANWIAAVVKDLQSAPRGRTLVVAGMHQPAVVHAVVHAINQALGNIGSTVTAIPPVEQHFGAREGNLKDLVADMNGGRVQTLLILGGNPAYDAPADINFAGALESLTTIGVQQGNPENPDQPLGPTTPMTVHLGLYHDETAILCQWHVPQSHYLEAWSDATAHDGTISIVQPLIRPLYTSRSAHELLAALLGQGDRAGWEIVREYWRRQLGAAGFEPAWQQVLIRGTVPNRKPAAAAAARVTGAIPPPAAPPAGALTLSFRPDPSIWDGTFNNNAWMQELPKPITQLTWDNAAQISPQAAKTQGLSNGDLVELTYAGRKLTVPVWVTPGQPDDSITLHLGFGRQRTGSVGEGSGFNAYALRTSDAPGFGPVEMRKAGGSYMLVDAQKQFDSHNRGIVREGTLGDFKARPRYPEFMEIEEAHNPIYGSTWPSDRPPATDGESGAPVYDATGYLDKRIPAWGMVIDMTACIGCNACTIACQAENNISTVGKDQVWRHRQMHWIRIDNYFSGDLENPDTTFQPVPCMHCEKAPCEPVCPVEATTTSAEGINEMTYNRCVGTRYCSNNCPYKVRRFNFLQYADQHTPSIQLMRNPDVTVRSRGVMEKCTYCVQRVNEARIQAEKEERDIRDGDVVTACQQACPTQAIIFGNANDVKGNDGKGSAVRQLKDEPLNYGLLTELNTRPRTTYLAKLTNPNPALGGPPASGGE